MGNGRIIFHIDMNCFFVSCELANIPELRDKPVAVAPLASRRKSIILSANYEARKYGIHAAMSNSEAQRLCPNLILLESHMDLYSEKSRKFFEYFLNITPLVEPASIDEGYLDVTEVCQTLDAVTLAHHIQDDLLSQFSLPCSIGIAPNKLLAKIASDMKKPLGITILRKRDVPTILWPEKVNILPGVGKKTMPVLEMLKIKTVGDLANFPDKKMLIDVLGPTNSQSLIEKANGEGSKTIETGRFNETSSISNSQTFDNDEYDITNMKDMLKILTNSVSYRLEKYKNKAYTLSIQIKYSTMKMVSKTRTINNAINDSKSMYHILEDLFDEIYEFEVPIRLIGVSASKLIDYKEEIHQISIYDDITSIEKNHVVSSLIESINQSYGKDMLKQGISDDRFFSKFDKTNRKK